MIIRNGVGATIPVQMPKSAADLTWTGAVNYPFSGDSDTAYRACLSATNADQVYCAAQVGAAYADTGVEDLTPASPIPSWLIPAAIGTLGFILLLGVVKR